MLLVPLTIELFHKKRGGRREQETITMGFRVRKYPGLPLPALMRAHWECRPLQPECQALKAAIKTVPSIVELSPETSYTSLFQTIFYLNLFMIQGRSSPPLHLERGATGL